jgi:NodT family efflux transporter outer membrane factor (OMF) lipoprotein
VARRVAALVAAAFLAACTLGPDYVTPSAPSPVDFKERKGWKPIAPMDLRDRGAWWAVYKDPLLSSLASQVAISNQTVAAAVAAYEQTRQVIREGQAGLFPTVTASYSATGSHATTSGVTRTQVTFNPQASASWELDVWGRIRRTVESDAAAAQVSAADLANATLSAQAQLATAYFNLRTADALKALLDRTVADYKRTLAIVKNQYDVGTSSKADYITALTQVLSTEASAINVGVQRAQYEHAIAVLIGRSPAELSIPFRDWRVARPPAIPVVVPSLLLERRPDIAASERQLQELNALIGVAVANFYPVIDLSGAFGFAGGAALPISAANEAWSLAASATQTVFDGGLRTAQLAAAKASYLQGVATYRQTVLTAFQQVEDQLAALRILAQQGVREAEAVRAARQAVDIYLNQYRVGTVAFTAVVTAQATLLADEETALTVKQNLFLASVSLIEALGGGWDATLLPRLDDLSTVPTITPPL